MSIVICTSTRTLPPILSLRRRTWSFRPPRGLASPHGTISGMSAPFRSGDLKDARLVDVFDACCRGGQATVVRVFLGPPGATDMQGAVFFEDGEITDAHLEDSEGLESLR